MVNAFRIDDHDVCEEYDMIFNSKSVPPPLPKTSFVEVPGGHGKLDLSEAFGEVKFNNRTITIVLTKVMKDEATFYTQWNEFVSTYSGKKLRVWFSEEFGFYYVGRIVNINPVKEKNIWTITLEIDCEPWHYVGDITIVNINATSTIKNVTLKNLRKRVIPKITTTNETTITFAGKTVNLSAGTTRITDFVLDPGDNIFKVSGSGTVTFEYQEGGL